MLLRRVRGYYLGLEFEVLFEPLFSSSIWFTGLCFRFLSYCCGNVNSLLLWREKTSEPERSLKSHSEKSRFNSGAKWKTPDMDLSTLRKLNLKKDSQSLVAVGSLLPNELEKRDILCWSLYYCTLSINLLVSSLFFGPTDLFISSRA